MLAQSNLKTIILSSFRLVLFGARFTNTAFFVKLLMFGLFFLLVGGLWWRRGLSIRFCCAGRRRYVGSSVDARARLVLFVDGHNQTVNGHQVVVAHETSETLAQVCLLLCSSHRKEIALSVLELFKPTEKKRAINRDSNLKLVIYLPVMKVSM